MRRAVLSLLSNAIEHLRQTIDYGLNLDQKLDNYSRNEVGSWELGMKKLVTKFIAIFYPLDLSTPERELL